MTEHEPTYNFSMSGSGTPRGELLDPSSVTVHLDPAHVADAASGKAMFERAITQQRDALAGYADAIDAAGGDVTAAPVQLAATALHEALQFLPIAHTAYAGVGFPTARLDGGTPRSSSTLPARGERGLGVHPDMLTAIQGDVSQRWDLAGTEDLPLAVEIALATDPDPQIRTAFIAGLTRSRTVVLLMEQRETDPDVLEPLAAQSYASPDRKFPLRFGHLAPRELEGLYELLGLDEETIERAGERWARAQDRDERITVEDALLEIGAVRP